MLSTDLSGVPSPGSRPSARGSAEPVQPATSTADDAPDSASRQFAAETILARLDDLRRLESALDAATSAEDVHQTRVACRRLRTALSLFEPCFSARQVRRWRKGFRTFAKGLGATRDLDVRLAALERPISGLDDPRYQAGLDRLRLRLTQKRRRQRARLRRGLKDHRRRGITLELDEVLRDTLVRSRSQASLDPGPRPWIARRANEAIGAMLEEMLCYEPCIDHPERSRELHRMRIAAKHLRDAMEIVAPVAHGRLDASIERVRAVQRMLGDLHDCDVWLEELPRFLEKERRRTRRYFGHERGVARIARGVEALERNRRAMRAEIHRSFVEFWRSRCGPEAWTELRTVLASLLAGR